MRLCVPLLVTMTLLAMTLLAAPARAEVDPQKRAISTGLFDEARALMTDGKFAEACPKLEEAQRLDPGIGILYNLSECYWHVGKTASAYAGFRDVAAQAQRAGQVDREVAIRARVDEIEPKLTRLRVMVNAPEAPDEANATLVIMIDDAELGAGSWGSAIPVDPGEHDIVAKAPGYTTWRAKVTASGEGVTTDVDVPALVLASPQPPPPLPPVLVEPSLDRPTPWHVPTGAVFIGTGAVALGVGIALGAVAKSKADEADCDADNACSPQGLIDRDSALTQAHVGTALTIGGAALAAAGGILFIVAPGDDEVAVDVAASRVALRVRW